jgi:hypothetical protein
MNPINDNGTTQGPGKMSAHERLKKAARELELAVIEQREQVEELQGNMTALDRGLDRLESSFTRAHQALAMDDRSDLVPAAT